MNVSKKNLLRQCLQFSLGKVMHLYITFDFSSVEYLKTSCGKMCLDHPI